MFARSLAPLGDLDGDGVTELAVGAPRDRVGEMGPKGAVWVLSLERSGRVKAHHKITDNVGMDGLLNVGGDFGSGLAPLGDLDGDGVPDLLAGARGDWAGGNHGALWLLALDGLARVDFEHGDDRAATPLANGRSLAAPGPFARTLAIESAGANLGAAIFDSTPLGPNDPSQDRDLLVGKGNVLILQNSLVPTQTVPGIFDRPNDDQDGGRVVFRFPTAVAPLSLDLVDVDPGGLEGVTVRLLDADGRVRTYLVPGGFTEDLLASGPPAWRRLDLTTLAPQMGHAVAATAVEEVGFDARAVLRIEVDVGSSGAIDGLTFDPRP